MGLIRSVVTLILLGVSCAHGAQTRFTIVRSSPNHPIAFGLTNYSLLPEAGWLFLPAEVGKSVFFRVRQPASITDWEVRFSAPNGATLAKGLYPDYQRYNFNEPGHAGLSFFGGGKATTDAGDFEILDIAYDQAGELKSLALNFSHYPYGDQSRFAFVELRYNYVPEPAIVGLGVMALGGVLALSRNSSRRRRRP